MGSLLYYHLVPMWKASFRSFSPPFYHYFHLPNHLGRILKDPHHRRRRHRRPLLLPRRYYQGHEPWPKWKQQQNSIS